MCKAKVVGRLALVVGVLVLGLGVGQVANAKKHPRNPKNITPSDLVGNYVAKVRMDLIYTAGGDEHKVRPHEIAVTIAIDPNNSNDVLMTLSSPDGSLVYFDGEVAVSYNGTMTLDTTSYANPVGTFDAIGYVAVKEGRHGKISGKGAFTAAAEGLLVTATGTLKPVK